MQNRLEKKILEEYRTRRKELIDFYFKIIVGIGIFLSFSLLEVKEKFDLFYVLGIPINSIIYAIHKEYSHEYKEARKKYFETLDLEERKKFKKVSFLDILGDFSMVMIYLLFWTVVILKLGIEIIVYYNKIK